MEQVSCKYCKTLFVPRKSKNSIQKFCKMACYFKHCRADEIGKEEIVAPQSCASKDEALLFCSVYLFIVMCTGFAFFVYWTY